MTILSCRLNRIRLYRAEPSLANVLSLSFLLPSSPRKNLVWTCFLAREPCATVHTLQRNGYGRRNLPATAAATPWSLFPTRISSTTPAAAATATTAAAATRSLAAPESYAYRSQFANPLCCNKPISRTLPVFSVRRIFSPGPTAPFTATRCLYSY